MAKQANLLIFNVSLEVLNTLLNYFKEGASIVPEDLQIFRMGRQELHLSGYYLIMSSKAFPLVKAGERVQEGIIDFNKGVLTWKKK